MLFQSCFNVIPNIAPMLCQYCHNIIFHITTTQTKLVENSKSQSAAQLKAFVHSNNDVIAMRNAELELNTHNNYHQYATSSLRSIAGKIGL
jgi:hypothetical protein